MEELFNAHKVVVLGGTGLIGTELIKLLIDQQNIAEVITIGRRASSIESGKIKNIQMNLERIDGQGDLFEGVSAVFCCLGTTIKQAKSREAFRMVDFDFPLLLAKTAITRRVPHFLVISAQGASTKSPFFYSRVKGELEQVLKQLPFKKLTILKPGLLLGRARGQRPAEDMVGWLMKGLKPLWRGPLESFAAIEAKDVARAMLLSFQGIDFDEMPGLELVEIDTKC